MAAGQKQEEAKSHQLCFCPFAKESFVCFLSCCQHSKTRQTRRLYLLEYYIAPLRRKGEKNKTKQKTELTFQDHPRR